jgi:hypothetical protein
MIVHLNALSLHLYPLDPSNLYRNSDLWCDSNVWTHHPQPVEVQKPLHVAHVEHVEDFPGPINLPTESVFDHRLALSFNCYVNVLLLF